MRNLLFALYVLLCLLALTWPGYDVFGARIEAYVLGLPWSLAWVVFWVALTLVALVLYHATAPRKPS